MPKQQKIISAIIAALVLVGLAIAAADRPPVAPEASWRPSSAPSTSSARAALPQAVTPAAITAPTHAATAEAEKSIPAKPAAMAFSDQLVPFTAQAPTGHWSDERQQDGCEEASALMAMLWVRGETIGKDNAEDEITRISDFELKKYGEFRDIALTDVQKWIFRDYFKYAKTAIKMDPTAADIIGELAAGRVVLAPMNGRKLGNPYFSGEGPGRHMLLIRGYDPASREFITNDPGTKRGEGYRYGQETIMSAMLAYPTGSHLPVSGEPKGVLIVSK